MRETMAELLADYRRRQQACDAKLAELPTVGVDDPRNHRAHARLKAKSQTYAHCAEMLESAMERAS